MRKMYRVYDSFDRKWVKSGVYLSPTDVVIERGGLMKKLFHLVKLHLGSELRYIVHKASGMYDKNGKLMFEGDICKAKDGEFIGIATYVPEHCAFYLLDHQNAKFYPLGDDYRDVVEIVGNVFDNPDLIQDEDEDADDQSATYTNASEGQE